MVAVKEVDVRILLKLLNDKKVQQAIRGIAKDTAVLEQKNQKLTTSQKQLNAIYDKGVASQKKSSDAIKQTINVTATVKTNYVKLGETVKDISRTFKTAEGQIAKTTQTLRQNKDMITKTTTQYKSVDGVLKRTNVSVNKTQKGWRTTSQVIGQHRKILAQTQTSYKLLNGEMVKVTRHQKLVDGSLKTVNQTAGESKNSVDSLLGHFTKFRWLLVNITMAIGLLASVGKFAAWGGEIEKAMYKVSSVTKDTIEDVTNAATELRTGTIFSLNEVGDTMLIVSKKGYNLKETMDVVKASTVLAVGGFTDLETASTAITQILKLFNLSTEESINIINALTYVALNTAASIEDLTTALGYVGPMAQVANIEYEEMITVLGLLRDKGLSASKASTSLRGVIAKMIDPSRQAEQEMNKLSLSFFDADGNMKGLSRSMRSLGLALEKLPTQEEKLKLIMDIFGIRPSAGAAALIDIMEQGTFAIDKMTAAAKMSMLAQEAYDKQMEASANTMKAAIEDLKSSAKGTATFFSKMGVTLLEVFTGKKLKEYKLGIETLIKLLDEGTISAEEFTNAAGATPKEAKYMIKWDFGATEEQIGHTKEMINLIGTAGERQESAAAKAAYGNEEYKEMIKKIRSEKMLELGLDDKSIDKKRKYQEILAGLIQTNIQYKGELFKIGEETAAITAIENEQFGIIDKLRTQSKEKIKDIDEEEGALTSFKNILTLLTEEEEKSGSKVKILTQEYEKLKSEWNNTLDAARNLDDVTKEQVTNYIHLRDVVLAYKQAEIEKARASEISNVTTSSSSKITILYTILMHKLTNEIKDQQDAYNYYIKARFKGETAILGNIHRIELAIKKERLEQLKLQDTVGNTNDSLKEQQNEYKAWVETVHESIRALIVEGNLNAKNVSNVIKAQQTKLLATSKFNDAQKEENETLNALERERSIAQLEYELGMGEQHYLLNEHIGEVERGGEVSWISAQQSIDAMDAIKVHITSLTEKQKRIETRWREAQWQVALYKVGISTATDAINSDIDSQILWINKLIKEYKKLASQINKTPRYNAGGSGGSGGGSTSTYVHAVLPPGSAGTGIWPGVNPDVWYDEAGGHSGGAPKPESINPWLYHDFVSRPGEPIQRFSPDDTVIGIKDTEKVGGNTISIGEINISGVSGDADEFAREFTEAIERELKTR